MKTIRDIVILALIVVVIILGIIWAEWAVCGAVKTATGTIIHCEK